MKTFKALLIVYGVLLVTWEWLLTIGLTFSFTTHEGFFAWAFVSLTTLLNIPAIILSARKQRIGAYWLALNTLGSVLIAAGFFYRSCLESRPEYGSNLLKEVLSADTSVVVRSIEMVLIFWVPQVLFSCLLLLYARKSRQPAG